MQYCDKYSANLECVDGNKCMECNTINEMEGLEEDDHDDDSGRISVWDAADIWRSRSKDEKCKVCYTEEVLKDV